MYKGWGGWPLPVSSLGLSKKKNKKGQPPSLMYTLSSWVEIGQSLAPIIGLAMHWVEIKVLGNQLIFNIYLLHFILEKKSIPSINVKKSI